MVSMKCFIRLSEELHFGRAANLLNMTQPTLSQQIKKLETYFGVQLFSRSTRRVELTPAGSTFLPLAREALIKLEEAVVLSRLAAGNASGAGALLKIGAIDPAANLLLPAILKRFRSRFPDTWLDVRVLDSLELLRALERGECHVGIMREPTNVNFLRYRPLYSDRFLAVIPRQSPLASRSGLKLSDFVGYDVFTLQRFEVSAFQAIHDKVVATGIELNAKVNPANSSAALALASAGLGVTFLPEWIENFASSEVVLRRVEDLNEELGMGIVWRADNPVPGVLPFIEYAALISRQN